MSHEIERSTPASSGSPHPQPSEAHAWSRRSVIMTAAWATPAVIVAVATPVAAQSGVAVLSFEKSIYSGVACSSLTGVALIVRVNGIPVPGRAVTVTLPGSYVFPGGSSSFSDVSGSDGRIELPPITIAPGGGAGLITAMTDGGASISATLSTFTIIGTSADYSRYPAPPAGVSVTSILGDEFRTPETYTFLGSDGDVYQSKDGGAWTKLSSGGVRILKEADNFYLPFWATSDELFAFSGTLTSVSLPPGIDITAFEVLRSENFLGNVAVLDRGGDVYHRSESGDWSRSPISDVKSIIGGRVGTVVCVGDTFLKAISASGVVSNYPTLPAGVGMERVAAGPANSSTVLTYVKGTNGLLYCSTALGAWSQVAAEPIDCIHVSWNGMAYYTIGPKVYSRTTGGVVRQLETLPDGLTVSEMGTGTNGSTTQIHAKASDGYLYRATLQSSVSSAWSASSPYDVRLFFVSRYGRAYYALRSAC
jgi:hypothetical protein